MEVSQHFKNLLVSMLEMRMTQAEIVNTFDLVRELDFCDRNSFSLIYSFKKLDTRDQIEMGIDVAH